MPTTCLLTEADIANKVRRLASEIVEAHPSGPLGFVGIHTRGVVLAERVHQAVTDLRNEPVAYGTVDISLYRDDLDNLGTIPAIKSSDIAFPIDGRNIILFDDVLFTGRTVRAAIDCLMDYGRPSRIQLAVLVDRGLRELPIAADFVGLTHPTTREDHIRVSFTDTDADSEEGVFLL